MKPLHRISLLGAGGLTIAVLAATLAGPAQAGPAQAGPARAAASTGWQTAYRHHYGATANYSSYFAVVAPGRNDVWAFGSSDESHLTTAHPVAVRWNGRHWRASALPGGLTDEIVAASAPGRSDIWAVSLFGRYVLHWNGSRWAVAKRFKGSGGLAQELTGVRAFSRTNVWVFGAPGANPGLGTWHYNGRTWTQQGGAASGVLRVSALSPTNMWGIGSANSPQDSLVHYNGSHWRRLTAGALKNTQFNGIAAVSATNIWAVGAAAGGQLPGRALHWNGASWKRVSIPWQVELRQIVADGHGGFWMTATSGTPGSGLVQWIVHRSRSGAWSRSRIGQQPTGIFALARVPGSDGVRAAGALATATASDAIVLRHSSAR
ncbi:MAG TPA: hypothetical protein VGG35_13725 [Streptosporangiaceae bacterium]|jgi:hypothetical protein